MNTLLINKFLPSLKFILKSEVLFEYSLTVIELWDGNISRFPSQEEAKGQQYPLHAVDGDDEVLRMGTVTVPNDWHVE